MSVTSRLLSGWVDAGAGAGGGALAEAGAGSATSLREAIVAAMASGTASSRRASLLPFGAWCELGEEVVEGAGDSHARDTSISSLFSGFYIQMKAATLLRC